MDSLLPSASINTSPLLARFTFLNPPWIYQQHISHQRATHLVVTMATKTTKQALCRAGRAAEWAEGGGNLHVPGRTKAL